MKNFEKWWKRGMYDVNKVPYADDKMFAKIMWEAALKWANELYLDSMHPLDVIFEIQKELEEKENETI